MATYLLCNSKVGEVYAFDRFKRYQSSLGTPNTAIKHIWESCHTNVETRMRELPDNLEIVIE